MRLSGSREHGAPGWAVRIDPLLPGREQLDRDVNELIVQITDHRGGLAGHPGMGSMPRERIAKDGVFSIVRATPDDVARVKVAHDNPVRLAEERVRHFRELIEEIRGTAKAGHYGQRGR
jgi:hypothetical protein